MFYKILGVLMIGHGLAHIGGFLAAWTKANVGFHEKPWILPGEVTLDSPVGKLFGFAWLGAMVLLAAAGVGLLMEADWWRSFALYGVVCSLAAILPWLRTVPPGAWVGALFDLIILFLR